MGLRVALVLLSALYGIVSGQRFDDLKRLYTNLTTDYNTNLRPTSDLKLPTEVNASFILLSIKEYEEKTGKLAMLGFLIFKWQDMNMRWDPDVYGGISTFLIPQNQVWIPEIVNGKPYEKIKPLGFDRMGVRVMADGTMLWMPGDVYTTTCSADVTYFPFDVHQCAFYFSPWMYSTDELVLQTAFNEMSLKDFTPSGLWELKSTALTVYDTLLTQLFVISITFKRRPIFLIVNIFAPISVMGLLNVLVFLLPAESGERVGFSVTVLLAISVFLTIIAEKLPNTSQPNIPMVSYLLLGDLIICTLITTCTMLLLRFRHKNEGEDVPRWLRCLSCTKCCSKRETKKKSTSDASDTFADLYTDGFYSIPINNVSSVQDNRRLYYGRINKYGHVQSRSRYHNQTRNYHYQQDESTLRHNTSGTRHEDAMIIQESQDISSDNIVKWKDIADFFDSFFFVVFLLLIIAKNIATVLLFIDNI